MKSHEYRLVGEEGKESNITLLKSTDRLDYPFRSERDCPLLGTATAATWQRVLASSCRRDDRSRGIRFESPATGWVADTVAQRSESTVEGGLGQVARIKLPITQKPLATQQSH